MVDIESMSADELYKAGRYWPDEQYTSAMAGVLIKTEDAESLITLAGIGMIVAICRLSPRR
jgi:hypothetical protein